METQQAQTPQSSAAGQSNTKILAIIGYIVPVLFFIPLITDAKHNAFAKFHANQQLLLLIWYIITNVIVVIPVLGWIASPIMWIIGVILAIMGIINAAGGSVKTLPMIGKYELIK